MDARIVSCVPLLFGLVLCLNPPAVRAQGAAPGDAVAPPGQPPRAGAGGAEPGPQGGSTRATGLVVIRLVPHDAEAAEVIAASCTEALVDMRCEAGDEAAVGVVDSSSDRTGGEAKGRVPGTDDGQRALLSASVVMRAGPPASAAITFDLGARQDARHLRFDAHDGRLAQLRAIGLVVASVALQRAGRPARPDAGPTGDRGAHADGSGRPAQGTEVHARVPDSAPPWNLELGGLAGAGLQDGPARVGALLRVSMRPVEQLPISLVVALRFATRSGSEDVQWLSAGIGLAGHLPLGSAFALGASAEWLVQRASASANDPTTGRTQEGHAMRYGALLRADAAWSFPLGIAPFIGAEGSLLPRLSLDGRDERLGREPALRVAGVAGARF